MLSGSFNGLVQASLRYFELFQFNRVSCFCLAPVHLSMCLSFTLCWFVCVSTSVPRSCFSAFFPALLMLFLYLHCTSSQQKLSDDTFQLDGTVVAFCCQPLLACLQYVRHSFSSSKLACLPACLIVWCLGTQHFPVPVQAIVGQRVPNCLKLSAQTGTKLVRGLCL